MEFGRNHCIVCMYNIGNDFGDKSLCIIDSSLN